MGAPIQAVVLCGGVGARLRPLTYAVPKPLLPVGGRPILEHILDRLAAAALTEVALATGFRSELIEQHFGPAYRGTTLLLSDWLEGADEYTGVHSRDVVSLSLAVADEMALPPARRRLVEFGALLHDVGKIAVPLEIIHKAGPLDDEEWAVIRCHTVEGQRILDQVGGVLGEVGRIVRSSHERWDSRGYPDGLAGEAIPLESSIISCADAFHAMTSDRPYRRGRPLDEALAELLRNSGTQFRPEVVAVLTRIVEGDLRQRGWRLVASSPQDALAQAV